MRPARLLAVPVAALLATCALAAPATAADGGVVNDILGTIVISVAPSLDTQLSGNCTYTRSSAGVGNGGSVTFQVAAEGTALGMYKGVEIVATSVSCDLIKRTHSFGTGAQWFPGALAVANAGSSSSDASVVAVCIEVQAALKNVPIGESDNLITSGRLCKSA